jgi:L-amino acid N-acyltransferase YncA
MSSAWRPARPQDLPAIVAIYNATIPSREVTADLEPVSVESRAAWFRQHDPDRRPLWVVGDDKQLHAWLSFSDFYGRAAYSRTAEISVYVHVARRRSGLGEYLVTEAVRHAPAIGVDRLVGFIFGHNTPSLRLFSKLGFARWGHLPAVAKIDGIDRDLVIVGRSV